jgi:exosome complex component RRP45
MDRPNDGQVKFNVEVGPMGCMGYDVVAPASNYGGDGGEGGEAHYSQRLGSNRLLRLLERTLLIGGSIDAEALCVQSGVWVWRLVVDVTLLVDAGNALDACVLAVVAALRHFRLAQVDVVEDTLGEESFREMQIIDSDEREATPLPVHHTPVTATFALFSDRSGATSTVSTLIDPTDREELAADGIVTWSYNKYGEMCCLDFPGGCELSMQQLMSSSDLGKKRCIDICEMLETALLEAESNAEKERMNRLKLNVSSSADAPGFVHDNDATMNDDNHINNVDTKGEDEEYRKLALDYASGHIAASVKDRPQPTASSRNSGASSLFHAFLDSVKRASLSDQTNRHEDDMEIDITSTVVEPQQIDYITEPNNASDEITPQNAKAKFQNVDKSKQTSFGESSDEEEDIVQLQTEFSNVGYDKSINQSRKESKHVQPAGFQETKNVVLGPKQFKQKLESGGKEDADDLVMAVKKKKSKKAKKKNT